MDHIHDQLTFIQILSDLFYCGAYLLLQINQETTIKGPVM